jgi:putative ABC transport system substrate-binding protein
VVIDRRGFVSGLATALVGVPAIGRAQTNSRMPRVVVYSSTPVWKAALTRLGELGWVEGRNIVVEQRNPDDDAMEADVRKWVDPPVDAFIIGGPLRIRAAMKATQTIPIVGIDLESDPVASGFVKSLARPGTNVSGIWMDMPEVAGKQIQFLRETVPTLRRVGVVWDDRIGAPQLGQARAAAQASNVSLHPVALHAPGEADDVTKRLLAERPQAVLLLTAPVVFAALDRLAALMRQHRLPSISPFSTYPASGGLLAYGPDFPAMWRQMASYVDRILKGAKISDLPVERPSKFVLGVSVATAKTIGLTIPQSLLQRADQVIE